MANSIDRENVIKAYEDFVNGYECFCTSDDYEYEMHKAVLALLKEQQEAVEPINSCETFRCGKCRNIVGYNDGHGFVYQNNFCSKCGQAVKWE